VSVPPKRQKFKQAKDDDEYDRHPSLHRTIARRTTTYARRLLLLIPPSRRSRPPDSRVGRSIVNKTSTRIPSNHHHHHRETVDGNPTHDTTRPTDRPTDRARARKHPQTWKTTNQNQTKPNQRTRTKSNPPFPTHQNHRSRINFQNRANGFHPHPGGVQSEIEIEPNRTESRFLWNPRNGTLGCFQESRPVNHDCLETNE